MNVSAKQLVTLLSQFQSNSDPDLNHYTALFKKALLSFGSETADNLAAVELLDIGPFKYTQLDQNGGLRLAEKQTAVTDVLNQLEGAAIPPQLQEAMPSLTQEEFDAVLRVAVLVLAAFENPAAGCSDPAMTDEAR